MKDIFLVGIGGMAGSIIRYIISKNISHIYDSFPLGTFVVNIIGCLLAGVLFKYISLNKEINIDLSLFLIVGFCGGFTTFSAFTIDSINLLNENKFLLLFSYTILSSIVGILFCYIGMIIIKWKLKKKFLQQI